MVKLVVLVGSRERCIEGWGCGIFKAGREVYWRLEERCIEGWGVVYCEGWGKGVLKTGGKVY